jgi:hypothetical protein
MGAKQFHICLIYEQEDPRNSTRTYGQMIEVDLVTGNIEEFLDKIPHSISNAMLWVTVVAADGSEITFVDGMSPETSDGKRRLVPFEQLSADIKDKIRRQAKHMSRNRLEGEDIDPTKDIE